jgi:hypothetical protein
MPRLSRAVLGLGAAAIAVTIIALLLKSSSSEGPHSSGSSVEHTSQPGLYSPSSELNSGEDFVLGASARSDVEGLPSGVAAGGVVDGAPDDLDGHGTASLSGFLIDAEGKPIQGFRVVVSGDEGVGAQPTEAGGLFLFERLTAGSKLVGVQAAASLPVTWLDAVELGEGRHEVVGLLLDGRPLRLYFLLRGFKSMAASLGSADPLSRSVTVKIVEAGKEVARGYLELGELVPGPSGVEDEALAVSWSWGGGAEAAELALIRGALDPGLPLGDSDVLGRVTFEGQVDGARVAILEFAEVWNDLGSETVSHSIPLDYLAEWAGGELHSVDCDRLFEEALSKLARY